MTIDNLILLVSAEAGTAIDPDDPLEDRCRAAMKAVQHHWMVTDEDRQFKGAVAAVYSASTDPDERNRIQAELESLRDLAALMSGVPVDLGAARPLDNPIGLRRIWLEVTDR